MKPNEQSPFLTLGLSKPGAIQTERVPPSVQSSSPALEARQQLYVAILIIPLVVFLEWRFGFADLYNAFRLATSGHSAVAMVKFCKQERAWVGRDADIEVVWQHCVISFDAHSSELDFFNRDYKPAPGSPFSVLYLPYDPSVVMVGDKGDSAWRILNKKHELLDSLLGVIFCLGVWPLVPIGLVIGSLWELARTASNEAIDLPSFRDFLK